MRALVWHGDRDLRIENVDETRPGDGGVVFRVALAGICGSDLHGFRGHPGPRVPPLILGHEAVGTVDGMPGFYVPFPLVSCGECAACAAEDIHLCESRGLLGLDRSGVFAESVVVPIESLVPVPKTVPPHVAVLTEPLAVCVSALRLDDLREAERVLIVGSGPIGLLALHAARFLGAEVEVLEPIGERRAIATRLGATKVHADVSTIQNGSFDIAYDAVGIEPAWQAAIAAVRRGGRVTVIGLGSERGVVPVGDLVRRAIVLRGQYAYTRSDFVAALTMLGESAVDLSWVQTMPLEAGLDAFTCLADDPSRTVKVILDVAVDSVSQGG